MMSPTDANEIENHQHQWIDGLALKAIHVVMDFHCALAFVKETFHLVEFVVQCHVFDSMNGQYQNDEVNFAVGVALKCQQFVMVAN